MSDVDVSGSQEIGPAPPNILVEPWQSMDIAEFMESIGEEIQDVGTAWRKVDAIKRESQQPQAITELTAEDDVAHELSVVHNREERRLQTLPSERYTIKTLKKMITLGQQTASMLAYGNETERDEAEASRVRETEILDSEGGDEPLTPLEKRSGELYLEVFSSFGEALVAESQLVNKVALWTSSSANRIVSLIDWLESDQYDKPEYKPMLSALARVHFDPHVGSFISDHLKYVSTQPEMYQAHYASEIILKALQGETAEEETVSWLTFIMKASGIEVSATVLKQALATTPTDDLPTSFRNGIVNNHGQFIANLVTRYKELLTPYDRDDHRLIFGFNPAVTTANTSSSKKSPGKNGRTTVKQSSLAEAGTHGLELNEPRVIETVFLGVEVTNGYEVKPIQSEGQPAINALMSSKTVLKYLAEYKGSPGIAGNIQAMLESLLREPRGNGSEKMSGSTLKIRYDGVLYTPGVWHLNPNKRDLSLGEDQGAAARNSRVYFCTITPKGNGEIFILLDVANKNSATQQKGSFRKTR